ncbi:MULTISPECIES: alpha/beta fold hydrolase [Kitasatospora]|uniref:Putative carboxylesterase n=1 Tax=Kitasatospora setae (strain ATCC 33774 / DSM 43861 / JCM 3304 / KCC A-0304 / NBRC 14216 / KM-6054) TaxID=452652 RepID=E4N362_KITSK|nr:MULTISPECIES: alpha/beta fold hydrolase [Kitasatospora]BAJ32596.1 putative carboxylesterase [Kitasatospora setae KM-6054]
MEPWPRPRRALDVETSYGTVHVHHYGPEATGRGAGDPVVLLHGHAGHASNWYPQIAALGAHHPVYAVDTLDDPGRSVQRKVATGSAENAAWLGEVFAGLGLERIHLVGVSYGGWLALNQAVHGPDRLVSVTALDPGGIEKVPARFYAHMIGGLFGMLAPRRLRPALGRLLANPALSAPPEMIAPLMLAMRTYKPNARPAARPFDEGELASVRVPSLFLVGARSALLRPRRVVERVGAHVPGARTEIVPGAGHGLNLERPELVNERLLEFFASCPQGTPR